MWAWGHGRVACAAPSQFALPSTLLHLPFSRASALLSLSAHSHTTLPPRACRSQAHNPPSQAPLTMKSFQALIAAACIANVNAHMMMVCSATSCNTVSTLFMYRSRSRSIRTTRLCSRPPSPSSFLAWSRHGLPRLVPQQPEQRHRIDARWCPHDQDARRPRVRFHFRKYARRSSASFCALSLTHSPLALSLAHPHQSATCGMGTSLDGTSSFAEVVAGMKDPSMPNSCTSQGEVNPAAKGKVGASLLLNLFTPLSCTPHERCSPWFPRNPSFPALPPRRTSLTKTA